MLCLGSWASTYKAAGNWRFELYYFDFGIGAVLAAVIAAFTVGTLGFDGFSFMDDILHASKRQDLYGFLGGVVFNLGNMLLIGAVSVSGMAIAFPVALGIALAINVLWSYAAAPAGNPAILFAGVAIVLVAVILTAVAFRSFKLSKIDELVKTGQVKSTRRKVTIKGVYLGVVAGIFLGLFFPLVDLARVGDAGLGPYSTGLVFALGVFLSTFLYNLFFMNLPVNGTPIEVLDFFKGTWTAHVFGIFGGVIWYAGVLMNLVAATAEGPAHVSTAVGSAFILSAPIIASLWGLFIWKEYAGSDVRVRAQVFLGLALFLCGVAMVSVAPVWTRG